MALQHIACIDDEQDIIQVATMALDMVGGFRVTAFIGGSQAGEGLLADLPDLILMDVMMPGLSGPELYAALKTVPEIAPIPVVFMTARVQPSEREEYLALGALGVIAKPFDPMTLADELRDLWKASGREA